MIRTRLALIKWKDEMGLNIFEIRRAPAGMMVYKIDGFDGKKLCRTNSGMLAPFMYFKFDFYPARSPIHLHGYNIQQLKERKT
jgi:hypothetical protein